MMMRKEIEIDFIPSLMDLYDTLHSYTSVFVQKEVFHHLVTHVNAIGKLMHMLPFLEQSNNEKPLWMGRY